MDRIIVDLPCGVFGPLMSDWVINVRGRSAGDGVTGTGQVSYGSQPRWETTLDLMGRGPAVLAWRAILAKMKGRINILRVNICDMHRARLSEIGLPAGDIALLKQGFGVPFDDDVFFEEGVGFDFDPVMIAAATYGAGVDSFTINTTMIGNALQAGQWLSHKDWPYQVTGVDGEGATTVISFEPALRRPIPVGDEITLEATALMVFVTDLEGRMPLKNGKSGEATIQLIEWTNRP